MFGRPDDPDQDDPPSGDGTRGAARQERADKGHLVRYADAASEEHDGAVGVEALRAAVGAFEESGEDDAAVGAFECFAVEVIGETSPAARD